jgi:hypothetical protein
LWAAAGVLGCGLALSLAGAWACGRPAHRSPAAARLAEHPGSPHEQDVAVAAELGIPWLPPSLKRWQPEFAQVAARYDIPPALVAIITLIESEGNPRARGASGAIGLMQLMPSTAAAIAVERELASYSEARLWEPAYNVDFGAWYLSRQLATFGDGTLDSSIGLAAVAYYIGPQLTRQYLAGAAKLPAPAVSYRDLAVGLWNERAQQHSPTYAAWRSSLDQHAAARAPQ